MRGSARTQAATMQGGASVVSQAATERGGIIGTGSEEVGVLAMDAKVNIIDIKIL